MNYLQGATENLPPAASVLKHTAENLGTVQQDEEKVKEHREESSRKRIAQRNNDKVKVWLIQIKS